ncbi:PP2C family protein-serine/threonine phosphatase [Rhodoferax antarcticus]|uniref:PP2C family protein-serine/threonine phosphatase n=1 Tax=Rhodoferax antarcticus TaxID=81479 RepID=UPI0022253085|nr:PP2C family serine/threonine-protein phosphatase [Rhodoferax antarcticus]MCW2310682.1 serine/threonine protein phosphatase PrpC [Rhodoferax antarcticus]
MKFSVFQVSRKGARDKNEDRMGYCYTSGSAMFMLADGMGGHPEGEVAAQLAIQTMAALFQKEAKPELANVAGFLNNAVRSAHRQILRYAIDRGMLDAPRTTVVLAVIQNGAMSWTHCGDSRLYLIRQAELLMRSRDHSLLEQDLLKPSALRSDNVRNRNVLFTCLGSPTRPVYDLVGPVNLQQGDRVMLCSDGLWSALSEQDIVADLMQKPVDLAVPDLVEKALRLAGSHSDNVTCLALEWETPDTFETTRAAITTDSILDGVFASTVQAGWLDSEADDLDDQAIERSIAEINAAIRRSAQKKT